MARRVNAEFPEKLQCLFRPARYKVLYGGRGGAKSWGIARALLLLGAQRKLRILCARETQKSISDSVHRLLGDQVSALGLEGHYEVLQTEIRGANGTEFIFAGLRQNISNLKSYESVDICWVEEAAVVSKRSWDILIPTIRKEGSEIWISFNPELDTDETYKRFVLSPPDSAVVVRIGWEDNPWFPGVLKAEMEACRARSEDDYQHIWGGACIQQVEGAIYAKEMREVDREGRITRVPYDATRPVQAAWDIGDRYTAIWLYQAFPFEHRFIDYIEGESLALRDYLHQLQSRGYVYHCQYLPHDARSPHLGTGRSIEEQIRSAGFKVEIVPRLRLADGINMVRTVFPQCWFDGERCADGLQALRRYRWAPDGAQGQVRREPLHDIYSHPADAFRYAAVALKMPGGKAPAPRKAPPTSTWS